MKTVYIIFVQWYIFFISIVFAELEIRWVPSEKSDEGTFSVPLSQRYWDKHKIELPDYAKTDDEIAMQINRMEKYKNSERREKEKQRTKTKQSEGAIFPMMLMFLSILTGILWLGYITDQDVVMPQNMNRFPSRRYRKSKIIWDKARTQGCTFEASIRAVAYELQPFRISTLMTRLPIWKLHTKSLISSVNRLCKLILVVLFRQIQLVLKGSPSRIFWKNTFYFLIAPSIYIFLLIYLHRILNAGPMILILTAIIFIFIFGFNDEDEKNTNNNLSAYSVFNRGFQSLLGSVDVESLVNQYVGGNNVLNLGLQNQHGNAFNQRGNQGIPAAQQEERVPRVDENTQNDGNNRSRKSGKKARRRNLQERKDRQLQRERARELMIDEELDVIDFDNDIIEGIR